MEESSCQEKEKESEEKEKEKEKESEEKEKEKEKEPEEKEKEDKQEKSEVEEMSVNINGLDVESFQRLVVSARSVAITRPSNLAKYTTLPQQTTAEGRSIAENLYL